MGLLPRISSHLGLLIGGITLALRAYAASPDVMVVMSSELGPYHEAFQGFKDTFNQPMTVVDLTKEAVKWTDGTRIVVAFGGKAALYDYPRDWTLIYGMAPGTEITPGSRKGALIRIYMMPSPESVVSQLTAIQPGLRHLAVLWMSPAHNDYIATMKKSCSSAGFEIAEANLKDTNELPGRLRAMSGKVDALWVPADPFLLTPQNFAVIKEFSWSNKIPLYVPAAALVEKGATVSISSNYAEVGRASARAALQALKGIVDPPLRYPEKSDIVINSNAAGRFGLARSVLQKQERAAP